MAAMPSDALVRGAIARHVSGPAFAWFLERGRRRRGLPDKAAPVALLPGWLLGPMGAGTPILVLTDRDAGRQQRRDSAPPADDYRGIQAIVDRTPPRLESGLWRFGPRLDVRVRRGAPEVDAFRV